MNREFEDKFIPLKETGYPYRKCHPNQLEFHLQNDGSGEIYLIGNPPMEEQLLKQLKRKTTITFSETALLPKTWTTLLYGSSRHPTSTNPSTTAFVSTNSVTRYEHVGLMFPMILEMGLEIGYAYSLLQMGKQRQA